MGFIHHLPLIFVAIFLVYFRKASCDMERFLEEFHHIGHRKKALVSMVVMVAFVVVLLGLEMKDGAVPDLTPFLVEALAATLAVSLLDTLRWVSPGPPLFDTSPECTGVWLVTGSGWSKGLPTPLPEVLPSPSTPISPM